MESGLRLTDATWGGTIDPSAFRDADGALYLYYKNDGNNPAVLKPSQLFVQTLHVPREKLLHAAVDSVVLEAGQPHQLADDLRIRLSVEVVVGGAGRAVDLFQRTHDGASPGAVRQQKRPVDVEKNQLHACSVAGARVSRTPPTIVAAPTTCHSVGRSPSVIHATPSAISVWKLP